MVRQLKVGAALLHQQVGVCMVCRPASRAEHVRDRDLGLFGQTTSLPICLKTSNQSINNFCMYVIYERKFRS